MQNKPSFKFKKDDVFISYLRANPKYKIHFHHNYVKINGGLDNGAIFHTLESEQTGSTLCVYVNNNTGSIITPFYEKDSNNPIGFFKDELSKSEWGVFSEGTKYTGDYTVITSSLTKEYIIKSSGQASLIAGVSFQAALDKLGSLKNVYNYYRFLSPHFDFDKHIAENDGLPKTGNTYATPIPDYINLVNVPRLYKGNKIKEGSVVLSFYYTGSLIGEARDTYADGLLYETTGTKAGSVIGTVLYPEGLMVITASHKLCTYDTLKDGYLSPINSQSVDNAFIDDAKWVHFLSYRSNIKKTFVEGHSFAHEAKYAPASSSFTVEFKGETVVPTYTMFCHADKNDLIWSNNPSFVENNSSFSGKKYDSVYVLSSGSKHYEEREKISIKNIVSSSFTNHSESYSPTTYISKIGVYDKEGDLLAVANLSTPVKKTTEQDYTFKLKLDL